MLIGISVSIAFGVPLFETVDRGFAVRYIVIGQH